MNTHDKTKLMSALIDDYYTISVFFTTPVNLNIANKLSFFSDNRISDYSIKNVSDNRVVINVGYINIKNIYHIGFEKNKIEVIPYHILDGNEFRYENDDLGLTYSKEKSSFKVFAPTARKIVLNIFDTLFDDKKNIYEMSEQKNGIWSVEIHKDIIGKYYSFSIDGASSSFDFNKEIVDPYSKCVIGNTRRSKVIDINSYKREKSLNNNFSIKDSILYEIHIRDISIDNSSGIDDNRGKFLALTKSDTYVPKNENRIKTVLSHIKELGVNTVQIMPLQDFDNDESNSNEYNWGYMPKNFNTPDGVYSSNWQDDSKIKELLSLVECLHNNGLKVTLDVVYNHTAEGFFGDGIQSFNGFVPFYYYRIAGNGHISNGSGCGNEFRTESPMGRKFIVDSLKFWTEFYGFDGYRFDLMGLFDLETIKIIVSELKKVNPDIFIYGEPWTGGLTPIQPTYKGAQRNNCFSVFNDEYRDAIKGAVFNKFEKGYIQTKGQYYHEKIIQGILGSINTFASSPIESINYVEVHDNNTLFDKLYFTQTERTKFENPDNTTLEEIKKLHMLSGFLILTSQGIPILHLGQDFMRTKMGVENSYNSGDEINGIDWNRKNIFYEVFTYYKNLIEIRKKHPLFRIDSESQLRESIEFRNNFCCNTSHCLSYILSNGRNFHDTLDKIYVIINPYNKELNIKFENERWKKMLIGTEYFPKLSDSVTEIVLPPISGNILCSYGNY